MFDSEFNAGLSEVLGAKRGAIVGQQSFDLYAERLVVGHGVTHELHSAGLGFIGVHVGETNTSVIVDSDKQIFPASAVDGIAAIAGHAVAGPPDTSQLLDIDVQQVTRRRVLVAHHRRDRLQVPQMRQTGTGKHSSDGTLGHPEAGCDTRLGKAVPAHLHDGKRRSRSNRPWTQPRAGRAIAQRHFAMRQIAAQPLPYRGHAHGLPLSCSRVGDTALGDVLDHFKSTRKGESGILMGVHSAGILELTGGLAIPSFSNPVRMDTNNLLSLHS